MKHKHDTTGKWATLVPREIQSYWLTQVVYPAILQNSNPSIMPYVNFTLNEWIWKTGSTKQYIETKTTPVDSSWLASMQNSMQQIIKNRSDDLSMFGSFFFVMDVRGIKRSTNVLAGDNKCPYEALCKNFPSLDWKYMMDPRNGQLLMDLGMGFHPNPKDGEARIGLWQLDKLRASYFAAGMNVGRIHPFNTFSNYGGLQAEMPIARATAVHLGYRSSYNLNFEIIRCPGSEVYFCGDQDAHDVNAKFISCLKAYEEMFAGSINKSYGVREEI